MNASTEPAHDRPSEAKFKDLGLLRRPKPVGWKGYASWIVGILALGGLIAAVLRLGEIEQFVLLARRAQPEWLGPAVAAQIVTYVLTATVWRQTLRKAGCPMPLATLIPLGVAKLFTDQAIPSGGFSGSVLITLALERRGVEPRTAIAVLIVGLVSFNIAYFAVVLASLALLSRQERADPRLLVAVGVFAVFAVVAPGLLLLLKRWSGGLAPRWLGRFRKLNAIVGIVAESPTYLLRDARLVVQNSALQLGVLLADAFTLWLVFHAIAVPCEFGTAFVSFVMASVVATVTPIPLGVGTFEAASVAMLGLHAVPLEAALTATLLLRGLTFWLPMLPGLWLARRELSGAASR